MILLLIVPILLTCETVTASDICISSIRISGNRKTKDYTILRELPFRVGDVMAEDRLINQLDVATNHLTNTSLFNFVDIDYIPDSVDAPGCESCTVTIRVEERWYYWPQVSIKLEDRNLSNWLHEKDFKRTTIGWGMRVYNVLGLRHKVTFSDYFGYEKGLRLGYANIALDHKRTQMLGFSLSALFNRTINIASENDKVIYYKDPNRFIDKTVQGSVSYTYRPMIRTTHSFGIGYQRQYLGDSVLKINKDYWGADDPVNSTLNFNYNFDYEHRDYIVYPTKGYFVGAELVGATADELCFFYGELNLKLQYFEEFAPRWFWSSRLNTGLSFKNKRAYIYDRHVGYEDKNITGYDYYVVDGQHHVIMNNDIRFLVMPKKILVFGSSKNPSKFKKIHFTLYAKLTGDLGYVHNSYPNPANTLANTLLYGSGLGLDLVSYYDIVINCSYAINKMGKGGFYFGIKAPIF
ncbi:MAG: hypothetical protein LBR84_12245 [Tannerella sp.]|nr:hypothetical protein [Tannerella sp.]